MRLIDRYIFWQLGPPFFMGMVGALTILSFGQFLRALKYLTEGKVEKWLILKWFVFRVPEDMQYIFPAAALMATLFVFGRLSKDSELAALLASGISLGRLMVPVAVFGAASAVLVFLFNDRLVPPALQISQRIWEEKLRAAGPPNTTFKENVLVRSGENQLLYVGKLFLKDHTFQRMMVREYAPGGLKRIVAAPDGRWMGDGVWSLNRARETTFAAGGEVGWTRHETLALRVRDTPAELSARENDANELRFGELFEKVRALEKRGLANTRTLRVEMYLKTSFPFAVLIFAFIGAAIGISPSRSGGFVGFGVSLIFTFLYYVCMSLSASLGKTGVLSPLAGAWLHNLLFLVICVVLFARAPAR